MKTIITGGAGFIGSNAANYYLKKGQVVLIDNLSRGGTIKNLKWLKAHGQIKFLNIDVRETKAIERAFFEHRNANLVLHLAGQTAVTTSVSNPREDFEVNAFGTFNVLEGIRKARIKAPIIYCSTNKVYGGMEDIKILKRGGRYLFANYPYGISEQRPIDFHSPYGCSKGAAEQYVHDYHRIYGLNTVVFRMSCIYGPRQFGIEDQGWVAWFMIASALNKPLTVYGDGKQVRDVLYIDDLIRAFHLATKNIKRTAGKFYNIGGGHQNILSLHDLLRFIREKRDRQLSFTKKDWRPGDQKVYISDIRQAFKDFGWKPQINSRQGLSLLYQWISENKALFQ